MYRAFKISVKLVFALFLAGLFAYPLFKSAALTEETIVSTGSFDFSIESDVTDYIPDFVDVPEGGVSWEMFATTKSIEYQDKDEEGLDIFGVRPEFSEELKKLDGKSVLIQGYMFPLDAEEDQSTFLFGPFPMSCPFHYHVGPNLVIEAHGKDKIKFDWEAVNIQGRLELIARDDEYNMFYRLHEAEKLK